MEARVLEIAAGVSVVLLLVVVVLVQRWSFQKGRANRLQARVNEQHEQLGKQSELWNGDRDRLRLTRNVLRDELQNRLSEGELEKIRHTEFGRQVLGL